MFPEKSWTKMKQDDFEDYKKAVKQYYEKEKEGNFSSFLLSYFFLNQMSCVTLKN